MNEKKKNRIELTFWIILSCIFLFGVFEHLPYYASHKPPGTVFPLTDGYVPDYYQIISWIRQGGSGQILLSNRYTEELTTPILIHPLYTLMGFVTKPTGLSPFLLFTLMRIGGTIIFFGSFYFLCKKLFPQRHDRIIISILFFTSTSFWWLQKVGSILSFIEPSTGSVYFNIIGKFSLPPHHILSLACLFIILSKILGKKLLALPFNIVILLTVVAGFLNPSLLLLFILITTTTAGILFLVRTKDFKLFSLNSLNFIIPASLVLLYHFYHFQHTFPWSTWYQHMLSYKPYILFFDYIKALGPLFIFSFLSILSSQRTKPIFILAAVWSYLPIGFFLLKDSPLPFSYERIVQSYQYIPLSILGMYALTSISSRLLRFISIRTTTCIFLMTLFLFSIVPFYFTFGQLRQLWGSGNYYNVFVPNSAIKAFHYLALHSKPGSVVLSGETVSNMIPAFTDNVVLLGREDASDVYFEKKQGAFALLDGKMNQTEALNFLRARRISYLFLGLDTQAFDAVSIKNYPFLTQIYKTGTISIVKVSL